MNAEIITIGDEILIGQIIDTNSQWICKELNEIGVSVYQVSSIQDKESHILQALKEAESRVDIVIITGGLGPTKDDVTKKAIAQYFKTEKFIEYPEVISHIKKLFKKVNHPFNKAQLYQAQLPSNATLLMNRLGTAPGMWFYENETIFVSLPGVPYEMKGLITHEVIPRIQNKFKLPHIIHKTVMTYGEGESIIAERIESWEENLPKFIKLAYLPSFGRVRLRLSAKGENKEVLEKELELQLKELASLLSDIVTGFDEGETIERRIGNLLKQENKTICTAESLTGGRIASTLVSIAGASSYYKGSFITYSADLKNQLLEVPLKVIEKHTTVSQEVAEIMALSAKEKLQTDYAVSVTGNAGPSTDNNDKSVGLVYIAIAYNNGVDVHCFNFGRPREKVINKTVTKALELLQQKISQKI